MGLWKLSFSPIKQKSTGQDFCLSKISQSESWGNKGVGDASQCISFRDENNTQKKSNACQEPNHTVC